MALRRAPHSTAGVSPLARGVPVNKCGQPERDIVPLPRFSQVS